MKAIWNIYRFRLGLPAEVIAQGVGIEQCAAITAKLRKERVPFFTEMV
jgi:hypothetical protein